MSSLDKYFENLLPGGKVYQPGGRVVCMKEVPSDAWDLYFKGFKHLSLKEDALEYLKQMCDDDLEYLLSLKKNTEDEKIIIKAIEEKSLKADSKPAKKEKSSVASKKS